MRSFRIPISYIMLAILAAVAFPGRTSAQGKVDARIPAFPSFDPFERRVLTNAAGHISRGQFEKATADLEPILPRSTVGVFVDWTPVPRASRDTFRRAVVHAVAAWNQGLAGAVRFNLVDREEDADLMIFFANIVSTLEGGRPVQDCLDVGMSWRKGVPPAAFVYPGGNVPTANPASTSTPGTTGSHSSAAPEQAGLHRIGEVWISLHVPSGGPIHTYESIAHLTAQAIGSYLGLPEGDDGSKEVMGQDMHYGDETVVKPNAKELARALEFQRFRMALLGLAKSRIAARFLKPTLAIDHTDLQAGEVFRGDPAQFVYKITNTGSEPLEITAKPSCGCTVAQYDKLIQGGKTGEIRAVLNTGNFIGPVSKGITVTSNDPELPIVNLFLRATVKSMVTVVPGGVPIVHLNDNGPTLQDFKIQVDQKEPVEFKKIDCSAPYASAKVDPVSTETAKGREYKLTVTINGSAPQGQSNLAIAVLTSFQRQPQINISAICDKGILATPQSIFLGSVASKQEDPVQQVVTLSKNSGAFHIQKAESGDANLVLRQATVKDGKVYQIFMTYKGGWSPGNIRRTLTVTTDDPAQPKIEIPILANVAAATASLSTK